MPGQLECPMSGTNIDADLLYYSRGEDNSSYRPVLTGDVYENLLLPGSTRRMWNDKRLYTSIYFSRN